MFKQRILNIAFTAIGLALCQTSLPGADADAESKLISIEGRVLFARGDGTFKNATEGQVLFYGDRIRTGENSRAALRLPNGSLLRVNQLSTVEIKQPADREKEATISIWEGVMYLFSRANPEEVDFETPTATGAIKGTEFSVAVSPQGETSLALIDGEVELANRLGAVSLGSGDKATVFTGQPPAKSSIIAGFDEIQWCLHYPAALVASEIHLDGAEAVALRPSLDAYRAGNVLMALERYPDAWNEARSTDHDLYYAALVLAVGQSEQAAGILRSEGVANPLARALSTMIAAVGGDGDAGVSEPDSASEWLALSYYRQVRKDLSGALVAAQRAVDEAPASGHAWARLAEMEFSFGHRAAALAALDKSLELAPENAGAMAVRGFILAGDQRTGEAASEFERAIQTDGAMANAWLGRGLTRIQLGDREGGYDDLQVAAALEPNRSLLRSYLAKAFSDGNAFALAENELKLARAADPRDPTPWLYSSLLNQKTNRLNSSVEDMEMSIQLNDNRRVYRSKMLLDQDRAVRRANLASIYGELEMTEVSVQEASRAVTDDYGKYSSHLFLSNSYDALRDPKRINLRYETAWLSELLLANLLSPATGGTLSQHVSQNEYSALFDRSRLGLNLQSTWYGYGEFRQLVSHHGGFGKTSYAVDLDYHTSDGFRPNNDFERVEVFAQLKHQVSDADMFFVQAKFQDFETGDLRHLKDPADARVDFHMKEKQDPLLFFGWRHRWNEHADSLILAGRLADEQTITDRDSPHGMLSLDFLSGDIVFAESLPVDVFYKNDLEIYSTEFKQIFSGRWGSLIGGVRYQEGTFDTVNVLDSDDAPVSLFLDGQPVELSASDGFERVSVYAYGDWRLGGNFDLLAGITYDSLRYPFNFRQTPIMEGQQDKEQVSPKIGFSWKPRPGIALRGLYARALGGVSFDESVRLEPVQLAGFNQAFRSIIGESVVGSVSAPEYDIYGGGFDLKMGEHGFLTVAAQVLETAVDRNQGVFFFDGNVPVIPGATLDLLRYREEDVGVSYTRLIGEDWTVNAGYRMINSDLERRLPEIPSTVSPLALTRNETRLHQTNVNLIYNHRSGIFGRAEGRWLIQDNSGPLPGGSDEDFLHLNAFVGFRKPGRHYEVTIGVLNLTDRDYQLDPLSPISELPRRRTVFLRAELNF